MSRPARDPLLRLRQKYEVAENGCWLWTGSKTQGGYGCFWYEGRQTPAHRAAWRILVGEIAEGLDLDHRCRQRACVNPQHLEPVTRRENLMRGDTLTRAHHEGRHCGSASCRNCRFKAAS